VPVVTEIAPRTVLVDLVYLGHAEYIATCFLETEDGVAIVDPGPSVSIPSLLEALDARGHSLDDVRWLLLTHIHLDHGGASGTLVARNPRIEVCVHERGAPHLVDPARLLDSATRIYGDRMDELWGEFRPIPRENLRVLRGGETLDLAARLVDVAYTPGHAWHHVSYRDRDTGIVFVGDTLGERMPSGTPAIPTTPPPDIELEVWRASRDAIRAWEPRRLFLTHFGPIDDVDAYLAEHDAVLAEWAELVRRSLEEPGTDEERASRFADARHAELLARSRPEARDKLHWDAVRDCWYGLARYWRKKGAGAVA
jgi:glyoxylase-like metal-dependent hydrolase (beta-lactamase superfamily II)